VASRKEQKERARQQRLEAERVAAAKAARGRRVGLAGGDVWFERVRVGSLPAQFQQRREVHQSRLGPVPQPARVDVDDPEEVRRRRQQGFPYL